jgi:hypothetical protein
VIELVLIVSLLNLVLQLVAVYQRHVTLQHHRRNGGGE